MTILAGIISRGGRPIPDSACHELRRAITRNPRDQIVEFSDRRTCLLKVDVGAYGEPAAHTDGPGRVSLLAGEPLLSLDEGHGWRSRSEDLALLHEAWAAGDRSLLRAAQGTFCGVHYDPAAGRLSLVADKLGVRPLYYWVGREYVVFATALRIFERLSLVPKEMDLKAVTEMTSFGAPLGTRTPYANVTLLRAAEVVHVTEDGVARELYWRWEEIEPSRHPEAELTREAYEIFGRAVSRRLRGDTTAVAFLSGGLDSRSVVAALAERGVKLHTFNFAPRDTRDQHFGARFAEQVGALHAEAPMGPDRPHWSMMMAGAWSASPHRAARPVEREALVWSGDPGSVGLGHVYVYESVVNLLRDGKLDEAIEEFLVRQNAAVPRRFLSPAVAGALARVLHVGLREELGGLCCADPGRALHRFLLLNAPRRHLARHFEDSDLHRLEFQLPFYDSDVVAAVLAVPLELCLAHRLYMKWLTHFPSYVTAVPWQAYPGHEPCPLPIPPGLVSQWEPQARSAARKRELLRRAAELLDANDFPDQILKRQHFRLATWAYRIGLRDYGYLIEAAQTYHHYWSICGGRYVMPAAAGAG